MLLLIVLLSAGASLTWLRLARDVWRIAEHTAPSSLPVQLGIAGEVLAIPADLVRTPPGMVSAAGTARVVPVDRVELRMRWSRLPGFADGGAELGIDLVLIAGDVPFSAEERLARLYRPFFHGPEIPGPDGLIGNGLAPQSGYGGETLFFEPAAMGAEGTGKEPFMIRCGSEMNKFAPAICLRRLRLSPKLQLEYRYRKDRLDQWRRIDSAVAALMAQFRKSGGR